MLYFAQTVTSGAGFHCPLAVLQLIQRIGYFALVAFLMGDAVQIYNEWRAPARGDLAATYLPQPDQRFQSRAGPAAYLPT